MPEPLTRSVQMVLSSASQTPKTRRRTPAPSSRRSTAAKVLPPGTAESAARTADAPAQTPLPTSEKASFVPPSVSSPRALSLRLLTPFRAAADASAAAGGGTGTKGGDPFAGFTRIAILCCVLAVGFVAYRGLPSRMDTSYRAEVAMMARIEDHIVARIEDRIMTIEGRIMARMEDRIMVHIEGRTSALETRLGSRCDEAATYALTQTRAQLSSLRTDQQAAVAQVAALQLAVDSYNEQRVASIATLTARIDSVSDASVALDDEVEAMSVMLSGAAADASTARSRAAAALDAADAADQRAALLAKGLALADARLDVALRDAEAGVSTRLAELAERFEEVASLSAAADSAATAAASTAAFAAARVEALSTLVPASGGASVAVALGRVEAPKAASRSVDADGVVRDGLSLSASSRSSGLGANSLARVSDVLSIVDGALFLALRADGVGLPDYALAAAGASVIDALTSATYTFGKPHSNASAAPLRPGARPPPSPFNALTADVSIGTCWPFAGRNGTLGVRLAPVGGSGGGVVITAVTIDHAPSLLLLRDSGGVADSAPTSCSLYGLVPPARGAAPSSAPRHLLARFVFDARGPPTQTFAVPPHDAASAEPAPAMYSAVQLVVEENGGNPDFTCLYRFRVHGHPWSASGQTSDAPHVKEGATSTNTTTD